MAVSSSFPSGAAPEFTRAKLDKSNLSTRGCLAKNRMSGGTSGASVTCNGEMVYRSIFYLNEVIISHGMTSRTKYLDSASICKPLFVTGAK